MPALPFVLVILISLGLPLLLGGRRDRGVHGQIG